MALRRVYAGSGWPELCGASDEWSGFLLGGVLLAPYPLAALAEEAGAASERKGRSGLTWAGVTLLVEVRWNPVSRKPGWSKRSLRAALEAAGIEYRHERALDNPPDHRVSFRRGDGDTGRPRMREILSNGSGPALRRLADDAAARRVAVPCVERGAGDATARSSPIWPRSSTLPSKSATSPDAARARREQTCWHRPLLVSPGGYETVPCDHYVTAAKGFDEFRRVGTEGLEPSLWAF